MAKAKTTRTKTKATKATRKTAASKTKATGSKSAKKKTSAKTTKKAPRKKASKATAKVDVELENAEVAVGDMEVQMDRRRGDRRKPDSDSVENTVENVEESTGDDAPPKQERRQKVNRRRQIDPTTCERDYNGEEIEFMHALDEYKRSAGRMFPTCSEILEVVRALGYKRLTPEEIAILNPVVATEEPAADEATSETAPLEPAPAMSFAVREEYDDLGSDDDAEEIF